MRLRESVTAVLVALGAASAITTWTMGIDQNDRGNRLASLREPANWQGPYKIGVTPGNPADAREIVVRNEQGVPVYVSDPRTATTTVMRGAAVPAFDNMPRPASSLERAYAVRTGKGDRLQVASSNRLAD